MIYNYQTDGGGIDNIFILSDFYGLIENVNSWITLYWFST